MIPSWFIDFHKSLEMDFSNLVSMLRQVCSIESVVSFMVLLGIFWLIYAMFMALFPRVAAFTPQNGSRDVRGPMHREFGPRVSGKLAHWITHQRKHIVPLWTDVSLYRETLPLCPEFTLRAGGIVMRTLTASSKITRDDLVFPGLPVIFSRDMDVPTAYVGSHFISQLQYDSVMQARLLSEGNLSFARNVSTCWGDVLLGRQNTDRDLPYHGRCISRNAGFYAVLSESLNPVLVHFIPREAFWAASLLLYGPRLPRVIDQDMRLHFPIMQCKMQSDVICDNHLNAWYRVIFSYCKHVYNGTFTTKMCTGLIGSTSPETDIRLYECQSGEVDESQEMSESLTDVSSPSGDASFDAASAAISKNAQHHAYCEASATKTVDPGAAAGFSSFGVKPTPVKMGMSTSLSQQDQAKEHFITMNKGTRFEHQVRVER